MQHAGSGSCTHALKLPRVHFPQIDIWSKTLCEWFEGINTPAEPIYFMCPSDAFMAGVRSIHDQTSDRT